jgi:hypothetical protein
VLLLFFGASVIVHSLLLEEELPEELSNNIYIYDSRLFEDLYINQFKDRKAAIFQNSMYGG